MTNEEAIVRLKNIDIRDALQEDYDALHIAIKALEQQPSGDCISREQALKVIEKEKQGWELGETRYAIDECHTRVAELPSVTPQQTKWIPLNAKGYEPQKNGKYLVCFEDGYITALYYENGEWLIDKYSPIAWMPLPEEYKEE